MRDQLQAERTLRCDSKVCWKPRWPLLNKLSAYESPCNYPRLILLLDRRRRLIQLKEQYTIPALRQCRRRFFLPSMRPLPNMHRSVDHLVPKMFLESPWQRLRWPCRRMPVHRSLMVAGRFIPTPMANATVADPVTTGLSSLDSRAIVVAKVVVQLVVQADVAM